MGKLWERYGQGMGNLPSEEGMRIKDLDDTTAIVPLSATCKPPGFVFREEGLIAIKPVVSGERGPAIYAHYYFVILLRI